MRATYMISTLFGIGGRVIFPGTIGSLLSIFPSLLILYVGGVQALISCLMALFFVAYWAVDGELKTRYKSSPQLSVIPYDPQDVIIDEVIGQGIALIGVLSRPDIVLAFVLFRLFDIVKPWPICILEKRLVGALGILADDVVAGFFALLVLTAIHVLLPLIKTFF